ncbi:uncharacterized protein F4822DRAFT_164760 [Hypoxylon trugodes]|uniref:uncharacterized protein n=1 Tax=Hypoxylon trugodes TaxID=326681 RepID=UPI00218D7DD2|nr:uncharacterized protein F4822DRAFT_164760 [Hypoxylon trugodes]KAI1390844.1 hypothetical protein F4822DRAFT_164760 [Hypoxylon trugodes]
MSASRAPWRWQARLFSTFPTSTTTPSRPPRLSTLSNSLLRSRVPRPRNHRLQSTKPTPSPDPSTTRQTQRADAILNRASRWVPKRLHAHLSRLRSAPFSHVAAFLVLHEATAILPLFGLAYLFYSMEWVPTSWVLGPWAAWAEEGLKRYARWFRKRGWFGMGEDGGKEGEEKLEVRLREEVERERVKEEDGKGRGWFGFGRKEDTVVNGAGSEGGAEESKSAKAWGKVKKAATIDNTEKGYKIGIQIAAAYAITKMLFIPRIALSLWATPWLARGLVAVRRSIWKKRS